MKKKWILYFIGWLLGAAVYAQSITPSTMNSAGGSALVGTNINEWSFGEMVAIETAAAGPNTVTQGLLQPTYANNVSIDEHTSGLQENLILFPNPTDGNIFLQPSLSAESMLEMRIVDMSGKVLAQQQSKLYSGTEIQTFDLTGYTSGMYILQVEWKQDNKQQQAVYKIEKR
jgi:hypothetical protein